jgi:KaiC/GvpD/RAD55 family RecA-like ATPase
MERALKIYDTLLELYSFAQVLGDRQSLEYLGNALQEAGEIIGRRTYV